MSNTCTKYINDIQVLTQSGQQVRRGAAQVMFYNTGQSVARINNIIPIMPYQVLVLPEAKDASEIDDTQYTVYFDDNTVSNSLIVIRKMYV